MSLVAFGIRIAAVRAIRAAVWPEFQVLDAPQSPIALIEGGARPLITVYTGHDNDRMDGRDALGGAPRVTLTIQIFLPPVFEVTAGGQTLELDTREEAAETVLDVVARRIVAGFLGQADPWSQMLFQLVQKTGRTSNNSYLVESEKVRTSARELTLECDVIHEPIPGAPPADCWSDFVALMRTDTGPGGIASLADWIAGEIAGPTALSQAERDRIDLGLSEYAAQRVGIVTCVEDVNDAPIGDVTAIDEVPVDPDAPPPAGYSIAP